MINKKYKYNKQIKVRQLTAQIIYIRQFDQIIAKIVQNYKVQKIIYTTMETQQQAKDKKNSKNRVRVAIRVRPMINRQFATNDGTCVQYSPPNNIIIGKNRCFTFDHVFNQKSTQAQIYQKCVKQLVLACFQGYNAAVLAYGQTGSGKTFTMGTGAIQMTNEQEMGIVPRVIKQIFHEINSRKQTAEIIVKASFIQIYNEQIIDLLSNNILSNSDNNKNGKHSLSKDIGNVPTIREEKDGTVSLVNVVEENVTDCQQMLGLLHKGGCNRSTASTLMNDSSSRSHGIFAIHIEQHPKIQTQQNQGFITAKFYFVDLAGSERAKKTGASGLTLKQGININLGLLQLGNVISALSSTDRKQNQFITYRNSKLTRILQDSLGGNSNTYMISCISPAQSNYEQSLNTIKYATKAMNIKNKPIVNRDPHSAQVNALKQKILELQRQNKNLKKVLGQSGIEVPQEQYYRDARSDILGEQLIKLRKKLNQYEQTQQQMQNQIKQKIKRKNQLEIQNYQLKRDRDRYKLIIEKQKQKNKYDKSYSMKTIVQDDFQCDEEFGIVQEYQNKVRQLQSELFQQQKINSQLQNQYEKLQKQMRKDEQIIMQKNKQILKLKSNMKALSNDKRLSIISENRESQLIINSQPQYLATIKDEYPHHNNSSQQQSSSNISSDNEMEEELQKNKQFQQAEADFKASNNVQNYKLQEVEYHIKEQEEKLQALTQDQINLQYQLISEMKEQYHQKIMSLQKEKLAIIKQQEQMAGYQKNPKLKQKIQNLQMELREVRKKAKEQSTLQKQVLQQSDQIKKLANEIKMHKVQKIQINRKIKQDKNAYDKFKKQRVKQILHAKKQNIKKDKQIRKLALQNRKKSMQMTKKIQELNRVKKINEAIKSYSRINKKNNRKNIMHSVNKNKSMHKQQYQLQPSYQMLKNMQYKSVEMIITQEEIKLEMNKYDKKIQELEKQIENIIDEESALQFKLDKLEINGLYDNFNKTPFKTPEQSQLQANISSLKQRITNIEQNIIFYQQRYNQQGSKLPNFNQQIDIINNININSLQKMQMMLKLTYQSLRNYILSGIIHFKNNQTLIAQNQQIKEQVQKLKEELAKNVNQHQLYLARIREQMMNKYYNGLEQQHYEGMNANNNNNTRNNGPVAKIDDRERKNFQKKVIDLTKTNRQLSADVEMWRRKCSVIQQKYHNINIKVAKDKFIGRPREQDISIKKNGGGWNIGGVNSLNSSNAAQMLDEVNQMIQKIENKKKLPSMSEDEQIKQTNRSSQDAQFAKNRWDCIATLKASRTPILSMATHQNLLVTSGTKSINIWDQQNCKLIADLSNPNYLQGFVKSVIIVPEYSYIAAACQKQIFIWDIRTYNSVAVLRAHKDQVRCLYSLGNYLFSGGKGLSNSGSLFMWDFRMLQTLTPFDQKQKNIDIFALTSHQNTLYYGTRNHQVRRLTMQNRQVLPPFQPPHMDTVTSLAVSNNHLISGSKDKNLRLWALQGSSNNIRCTTHAFNDYVNTVQSDKKLPIFYAGSRDGQVKIAAVIDQKIKFIGGIIAHTQSVSSICSIGCKNQGIFLTGSADKTVKFWKPDSSTLQRVSSINNQNY